MSLTIWEDTEIDSLPFVPGQYVIKPQQTRHSGKTQRYDYLKTIDLKKSLIKPLAQLPYAPTLCVPDSGKAFRLEMPYRKIRDTFVIRHTDSVDIHFTTLSPDSCTGFKAGHKTGYSFYGEHDILELHFYYLGECSKTYSCRTHRLKLPPQEKGKYALLAYFHHGDATHGMTDDRIIHIRVE